MSTPKKSALEIFKEIMAVFDGQEMMDIEEAIKFAHQVKKGEYDEMKENKKLEIYEYFKSQNPQLFADQPEAQETGVQAGALQGSGFQLPPQAQ